LQPPPATAMPQAATSKATPALPAPKKSASSQPQLKCPMAGTFYIWNRTVRCQYSVCKKILFVQLFNNSDICTTTLWQLSLTYLHYHFILSLLFSLSIVFNQWKKRKKKLSPKIISNGCSNITTIKNKKLDNTLSIQCERIDCIMSGLNSSLLKC